MMEPPSDVRLVTLTAENLDQVPMFCGHSAAFRQGYNAKKEWTRQCLKEGLRYTLLQVNGHNAGMIEYIPGEYAWRGVEAPGYLFIHCFWVIGQNRKHGYGRRLLDACLEAAKGTRGVAVVVSKTHWLPTPRIFSKNGFELADRAGPSFDLLVRRFNSEAPLPRFKKVSNDAPEGLTLYHSHQCPYFQNSAADVKQVGEQLDLPVNIIHIDSARAAQQSPCLYGTLGVFHKGKLVTYCPAPAEKLLKLLEPRLGIH